MSRCASESASNAPIGCDTYGKKGGCPPAVPSIGECREFFAEYGRVLVLHLAVKFDHPNDRKEWSRRKNLELPRPGPPQPE
ncbi:DUF2284 domain-containing protein [Geobacter pickeringii]|uniref:DUF2284 domain-containing protein n=1 Tax=Geobacter pickeringii TaxID=345632 RepID=UPI00130DC774|nr:DUF2284 domain-containing protein [Geobacter pickeringii]